VLPAGAGIEVGREATAAAYTDVVVAVKVDRWSHGGTPSGTSVDHYQME
jgi:hypothetical protein